MVEARIDSETGGWSVMAPRRAARPDDGRAPAAPGSCPFCPGNEGMTPPEVLRVPAGARDWRVRVVPNLYAATGERGPTDPAGTGGPGLPGRPEPSPGGPASSPEPDLAMPFTGRHEVVIESAQHDWDLRRGDPDQVAEILSAMRERCRALADGGAAAITVFRNYGARAGASLAHPHSQIVALDLADGAGSARLAPRHDPDESRDHWLPPGLADRWRRAREHHERTGECLHDTLAAAERRAGDRVVLDDGGVLVFQPRAASVPHQTTLLPAGRGAGLAEASDRDLTALAATLPRVLSGLAAVLDDPAYNLVVHAGPVGDPTGHRWYRWHLTIYPRLTTVGGLEFATGVSVNPSPPESTAPVLRQAIAGR
ncbi:galactose-1-phosphate uridylyltransferase [Rugosimonospora acidiphila]|uniref:Galactose-1-phosphate uridylyltransferase n=1 Tax=Rugosimonospora acidiphila TaxID=556531 RepID=A0ABP9SMS3_9ACTN